MGGQCYWTLIKFSKLYYFSSHTRVNCMRKRKTTKNIIFLIILKENCCSCSVFIVSFRLACDAVREFLRILFFTHKNSKEMLEEIPTVRSSNPPHLCPCSSQSPSIFRKLAKKMKSFLPLFKKIINKTMGKILQISFCGTTKWKKKDVFLGRGSLLRKN